MNQEFVYTEIKLPEQRWKRLEELATRPTRKHDHGGFQDRLRAWLDQSNSNERTIRLAHQSTNATKRRFDDMSWVRNSIIRRNIGGWQKHIYDIFVDTHPQFSNLPIMPRPKRKV